MSVSIDLLYRQKAGIEYGLKLGRNDALGYPEDGFDDHRCSSCSVMIICEILISMLEDWQNDACVGKYLKELYKRSESLVCRVVGQGLMKGPIDATTMADIFTWM